MSVQLLSFVVRGIDDAPSIRISFGRPEDGILSSDIWSGRLEVWRRFGDYPKRGEVGASLKFLDHSGLGATDPIPDFEDAGLVPGEEYYYTVYAEDQDGQWYFGGSFSQAHTFPWPSAFDHTEYIYTRWIDGEVQKQDAANDLTLRRLIQVLMGEPADSFKTFAEKLGTLNSLDNIPGSLIIEKDFGVGWPTASHRSFTFQREESRNLPELLKIKGTLTAVESAMVNVSDYDVNLVNGSRYQFFLNFSPTIFDSPAVRPNIDLATDVVHYLPDEDKWQRANALAAFLEPIPDVSHGIDELFYKDLVRLFGAHNRDSSGGSQLLSSNIDLFVNVQNFGSLQAIPLVTVPPIQNSSVEFTENFDSYTPGDINGQGPWVAPGAPSGVNPLPVTTAQARSGANSLGNTVAALTREDAIVISAAAGFRYYVAEFYVYVPSGQTEEFDPGNPSTQLLFSMANPGGDPIDFVSITPVRIFWAVDNSVQVPEEMGAITYLLPSDLGTWLYVRVDIDSKLGVKNCYLRNVDWLQYSGISAQKLLNQIVGPGPPWVEGTTVYFYIQISGGATLPFTAYVDDVTITGVNP